MTGARDRALLLTGFAGALRRSELVSIDVDDLQQRDEGIVIMLHRSKTDQEGAGRRVALPYGHDHHTCPVTAIAEWQRAAGIAGGGLFRTIDRHSRVGDALRPGAVNLIVKRAAVSAQLDPIVFSGHSLRAGFCTAAAAAGATERAIANQTGHRSMNVLRGYIRIGSLFSDNAVAQLGL